jgi:hypothetical protein
MTESPPPDDDRRAMPSWLSALLITLAVLVVLFGVCAVLVMDAGI